MVDAKIEKNIRRKLDLICKKQGELHYKKVEPIICNSYRNADVIVKKSIINKLLNTVIIIDTGIRNAETFVLYEKVNIDLNLKLKDYILRPSLVEKFKTQGDSQFNSILNKGTTWIKFYKHSADGELKELDFVKDTSNPVLLGQFINNKIVKFILLKNYKLPLIEFDYNIAKDLEKLANRFNRTEMNYINNIADIGLI